MVTLYFGSTAALLALYAHSLGLNLTTSAIISVFIALIITIHYHLDDLLYNERDQQTS